MDSGTQRREGILLTVVGSLFVLLGVAVVWTGQLWIGLTCILFFGACAAVGVSQARRAGDDLSPWVAVTVSLVLALAGVLLIIGYAVDPAFLGWRRGAAVPVGILLVVFFGGGAVLLARHELRRRRRGR